MVSLTDSVTARLQSPDNLCVEVKQAAAKWLAGQESKLESKSDGYYNEDGSLFSEPSPPIFRPQPPPQKG